jgi:hypothetical protein
MQLITDTEIYTAKTKSKGISNVKNIVKYKDVITSGRKLIRYVLYLHNVTFFYIIIH